MSHQPLKEFRLAVTWDENPPRRTRASIMLRSIEVAREWMKGRGALMECVSAAAAAVVLLNEHTGALLFMCRWIMQSSASPEVSISRRRACEPLRERMNGEFERAKFRNRPESDFAVISPASEMHLWIPHAYMCVFIQEKRRRSRLVGFPCAVAARKRSWPGCADRYRLPWEWNPSAGDTSP